MRELRGEVGKKTPKKRWRIPQFYYVTGIKSGTDWASSLYGLKEGDKFSISSTIPSFKFNFKKDF